MYVVLRLTRNGSRKIVAFTVLIDEVKPQHNKDEDFNAIADEHRTDSEVVRWSVLGAVEKWT